MTTPPTSVVWYHDFQIENGVTYPLRHRLSAHARTHHILNSQTLGLTNSQAHASTTIHELAHATLWIAAGIHVRHISIHTSPTGEPGGHVECGPVPAHLRLEWAIAIAAGERAQDRWLRENDLWTSDLAADAEIGARHDRQLIFDAEPDPMPRFGTGGPDYADFHTMADHALDQHWQAMNTVMPHLLSAGHMTGDELAPLLGLTNPPTDAAGATA